MEKVADNKYQQVAAILRKAAADAGLILIGPGDELHQIQIKNTLEREASRILLITGSGDLQAAETPVLGPAKTIGGEPIKKLRKFTEADMVPSDDKLFQLKQEVNSAIFYFKAERTPESLIAQIPDLVIRGVAKKVGMTVTKDEPKVMSPEFVGEIQKKAREQFPNEADSPDGDVDDDIDTLQSLHAAQMASVKLPDHIEEQLAEEQRAEKQQHFADLNRKANDANQRHEALRMELASEPNKNKRTAIRKQITDAEIEIASLKKQLEDANKD